MTLAGCSGSSSSGSADAGAIERDPVVDGSPGDASGGDSSGGGSGTPDGSAGEPGSVQVNLTAQDTTVASGSGTSLSWNTSGASQCEASGGWSGTKSVSGSEAIGPIDSSTTYSLNCEGPGGNAVAMISVSVTGSVELNWQAPTQNVDGTPLTNLAGYRIYYGAFSQDYTDEVEISSPNATSRSLALPSGTYYFAMTSVDDEGNESEHSNEVVKEVE